MLEVWYCREVYCVGGVWFAVCRCGSVGFDVVTNEAICSAVKRSRAVWVT